MGEYDTKEIKQEQPLFETEVARYFFVVTHTYSPITGGVNLDLSLRRQEKDSGQDNELQ